MEIAFVSDCFAQAKCEDDAKDLKSDQSNNRSNNNVQIADHVVVNSVVAPLKKTFFEIQAAKNQLFIVLLYACKSSRW